MTTTMDGVRPFTKDDIGPVADLFQRVFRKTKESAPSSLKTYFREIYFENPWFDQQFPSLVYESRGRIQGFLGKIPFPMTFKGREIVAAIGGNYMVDPEAHNPFAGVHLLKVFLSGSQRISMTDTGNELALKMWKGLGGSASPAHSMQWIRLIRPGHFGLSLLRKSHWLAAIGLLGWPVSLLTDEIIRRVGTTAQGYTKELENDQLRQCLEYASKTRSLSPNYTRETLQWLLSKAAEKRQYGTLRRIATYGEDHSMVGWFLYYPNRNGIAQVLQIGSVAGSFKLVLDLWFKDANENGSLAVMGRMEPNYMKELTEKYCFHVHRSNYLLVHSTDVELSLAVHSGDAFLTRLEGEWWTRFQGDSFEE
jgi:hypothetical protein